MNGKYIDLEKAEKELIRQQDSIFKLVNEKVKPEDCFIKRNTAYTEKLFKFAIEAFIDFLKARAGAIKNVLDAHAPEATTDLSDAPEEIKEEIISNAKLLEIRDEQSTEVTSTPKTSGLEFFTDEELIAEISRRMAINA